MSSLRSIAEEAGVSLLTAYAALNNSPEVDEAAGDQVRRAAAQHKYALNITIRDVAALAGVSVSTVSYVINDSSLIKLDTRRKVRAAIQALGYRPNSTARNLKSSTTRMIGYAWHRVQDEVQRNPVLDRFLYEVAQAAESNGYHVLTFAQSAPQEEQSYVDLIRTSRVDGFVLSDTSYHDPRIRRLLDLDIPFACFGRSNDDWDFPYADDDGEHGVGLVVDHLVAQGHTQIAMVGWLEGIVAGDARVRGYQEALRARGIDARPDLLARTPNDVPHAATAAEYLLSRVPRPTAIICASDIGAIGVRLCLERSGILIGKDIAVAGYDDTPVAQALDLTSVHQKIDVIARSVTDLLIERIRGVPQDPRHLLVAPSLIARASSTGGHAASAE
ncbi:MAG TPA: substrate-binding domain-containing protein [Chloroflexota bacterium]|jgi:LacI family transcriptional regulator